MRKSILAVVRAAAIALPAAVSDLTDCASARATQKATRMALQEWAMAGCPVR